MKLETLEARIGELKKLRNERDRLQNALASLDSAISGRGEVASASVARTSASLEISIPGGQSLGYPLPLSKVRQFVVDDLTSAEGDFDQAVSDLVQEWRDEGGTLE